MTAAHASGARPRVLFVAHTRYSLPLTPSMARKWEAVEERLDFRVLATGEGTDERFTFVKRPTLPVVRGAAFYASLAAAAAREIRSFRPDVVIAQSPYEAFALLRAVRAAQPRPKLIVEVHGDWRTAARLYGPPSRRLVAPAADATARRALRAADGTRAITAYTAEIALEATGREPLAVFPAYFDLASFTSDPPLPLPEVPTALWVGVLQSYKNPAGFARAWLKVAAALPDAQLIMVGDGPQMEPVRLLQASLPGRVRHEVRLQPGDLSRVYDQATLLALPSLSEGMGRVIIEAFVRGRPVVASAVGGIPDLVRHDGNGLLVPPGDDDALAEALIRVLSDAQVAERLAAGATADAAALQWTADRYADALLNMVERVLVRA